MSLRRCMTVCLVLLACAAGAAQASVTLGGTRVVYPSNEKEVTVSLLNEGPRPVLVQVWMDTGDPDATPDNIKTPFVIRPPIFRMDPGRGQAVRIAYTGEPLPTHQETMYWFNALEVPPKATDAGEGNRLQFAFRTRVKFIFRPDGLPGAAPGAFRELRWAWVQTPDGRHSLQVSNPTPYYINFAQVGLLVDGKRRLLEQGGMVAPNASATFSLDALQFSSRPSGDVKASFDVIDDNGEAREQEAVLVP